MDRSNRRYRIMHSSSAVSRRPKRTCSSWMVAALTNAFSGLSSSWPLAFDQNYKNDDKKYAEKTPIYPPLDAADIRSVLGGRQIAGVQQNAFHLHTTFFHSADEIRRKNTSYGEPLERATSVLSLIHDDLSVAAPVCTGGYRFWRDSFVRLRHDEWKQVVTTDEAVYGAKNAKCKDANCEG